MGKRTVNLVLLVDSGGADAEPRGMGQPEARRGCREWARVCFEPARIEHVRDEDVGTDDERREDE